MQRPKAQPKKNQENILTTIKCLHIMGKFLFLTPYSYTEIKNNRIATGSNSKVDYIILFVKISMVVALDYFHKEEPFIRAVQATLNIESVTLCLLEVFLNRHMIAKALNNILQLEKNLLEMGYVPNYKKYRRIAFALIIINVATHTAMSLKYFFCEDMEQWDMIIIYHVSGIIMSLHCSQFICFVVFINDSLQFLRTLLCAERASISISANKINTIRMVYSKVWKASKYFNSCYNVMLLLVFGHAVFNTIVASYFWLGERIVGSFCYIFEAAVWISINMGRLLVVLFVCHLGKLEVIIGIIRN